LAEFRTLFCAQVVSVLGTVVAQVALTVLVYQRTESPVLSALTFTLTMLPYLLTGSVLTDIVGRLPPRRTLVICDVASAICAGVLAAQPPLWALLGLIFLLGLLEPLFVSVRVTLLPRVLGAGPAFILGRSLFSMTWAGAQTVGYAVGGVLLGIVGTRGSLAIDAGSFLASAVLLRLGIAAHTPMQSNATGIGKMKRTLRSLLGDSWIRSLLVVQWILPACAVAPKGLAAPYVQALGEPSHAAGYFLSALAGGLLISNLAVARLLTTRAQQRFMIPAALVQGLALITFLAGPGWPISLALMAAIGAANSWSLGRTTLLMRAVVPELHGPALVLDNSGLMLVQGLGFVSWGLLAEALSLRATLATAGAVSLLAFGLFAIQWRGQPRSPARSRGTSASA
jgi:predicted MFS family arabinose efflux permease